MIDRAKIYAMLDHWFNSEINGYIGSEYGPDLNSLLLGPLDSPVANAFIAKMKNDLPILKQLSADELSLYSVNEGFETKVIYLKAGDVAINLNQIRDSRQSLQGETFDVDAS